MPDDNVTFESEDDRTTLLNALREATSRSEWKVEATVTFMPGGPALRVVNGPGGKRGTRRETCTIVARAGEGYAQCFRALAELLELIPR